ncbi:hypothetical protein COHA_009485 [Chlorella ohadii]|uniref:Amidase domain-containing protein n=1 Tax=Chlorella ohadii TaxID=2649997 RepID=A0AAD5DI67_9CHLO|nr:hypothetical protein COHA_009485 [Chlorella ohadii]
MLAGNLTCSQLVAAYLQRILAFDQPLQLNSIRALNPSAMERAKQLDAELAAMRANGTSALPSLFCVPLLVKDNIDVAGLATTAGSVSLSDNLPPEDAKAVAQLQQRGALVLAKTSMGEFAFFPSFCLSSLSGTVRNPYNLARTPAGSSGGSAAATAASLGMAALGTDTGNSVRGPSSHTALVGFRPSLGLVSRSGVVPLRMDRDTIGPMARTVEDAVRVFEGMVGPVDPADPLSRLLQNVSLPTNFTQFLNATALKGVRIGVFRQISQLPGADPEILGLFEDALRSLRLGGATLVDQFTITGNRLGLDWDADKGGDGPAIGNWNVAGRWEDLWADQAPFRVGIDAYLAAGNASVKHRSLEAIYRSGEFHPEVEDELLAALRTTNDPEDYPTPAMKALGMLCGGGWPWLDPCREEFRRTLVDSMDRLGLAAVVYPTWNRPPLRVGDKHVDAYDGNNSPLIAPHTGSPAITVPMGFVGECLPAGLQFLGRPLDDSTVIGLAYAYEQLTQHRRAPALFRECTDAAEDYATSAAPQAG